MIGQRKNQASFKLLKSITIFPNGHLVLTKIYQHAEDGMLLVNGQGIHWKEKVKIKILKRSMDIYFSPKLMLIKQKDKICSPVTTTLHFSIPLSVKAYQE